MFLIGHFDPWRESTPKSSRIAKKGAEIWQRHGANECRLLTIQGGDVGCMSFIAMFDNAEAYGRASDAIGADPEYQALSAELLTSLTGEWVRHNLARSVF